MKLLLNRNWWIVEESSKTIDIFRECSVFHSVSSNNTIFVPSQKITLDEEDMIDVIHCLCYPYTPNEHPDWNPMVLFEDQVRIIIS